jgi:hypothetical protein
MATSSPFFLRKLGALAIIGLSALRIVLEFLHSRVWHSSLERL